MTKRSIWVWLTVILVATGIHQLATRQTGTRTVTLCSAKAVGQLTNNRMPAPKYEVKGTDDEKYYIMRTWWPGAGGTEPNERFEQLKVVPGTYRVRLMGSGSVLDTTMNIMSATKTLDNPREVAKCPARK